MREVGGGCDAAPRARADSDRLSTRGAWCMSQLRSEISVHSEQLISLSNGSAEGKRAGADRQADARTRRLASARRADQRPRHPTLEILESRCSSTPARCAGRTIATCSTASRRLCLDSMDWVDARIWRTTRSGSSGSTNRARPIAMAARRMRPQHPRRPCAFDSTGKKKLSYLEAREYATIEDRVQAPTSA